jgi:hypothetical protein
MSRTGAEKTDRFRRLQKLRAPSDSVLSVYLWVPVDLADHRGLATRGRELIKSAGGRPAARDVGAIEREIALRHQDWLGHTVALFACAELPLFEAIPLPGQLTERAVLATRPYTLPLLAADQRNPAYRAAVIDARNAWIFAVTDQGIETVAERTGSGVASQGFGGWYGLEARRVQQRVMRLSRLHFRETITILERTADGCPQPLLIGGQDNEVSQFLALLPRGLRRSVAGTFSVDLRTVTPARVRELTSPLVTAWHKAEEKRAVDAVLTAPPGSAAKDLADCLAAARTRAVAELVVADDRMVPGFRCDRCGALGATPGGCDCPDPRRACRSVPDLLDELARQVLDDGGQVMAVASAPFAAAARLRFRT